MRFLAVLAVLAAACSAEPREPVVRDATPIAATFEVTFVDTIDGAPATHVAVGGRLRVRAPGTLVTAALATGPFAVAQADDTLVIVARGPGAGVIEIETLEGVARIGVSAAPLASASVRVDGDHGTVVLRDAGGNRLVDASLRIAPGSTPVTFARDVWDRVELGALPGDVLVKTDIVGATRAAVERGAIARR
jgi:hypothetical protein